MADKNGGVEPQRRNESEIWIQPGEDEPRICQQYHHQNHFPDDQMAQIPLEIQVFALNEASNHVVDWLLDLSSVRRWLDLCPFFGRVCIKNVLVYIGDGRSNIQNMLDMITKATGSPKQMGKHMINHLGFMCKQRLGLFTQDRNDRNVCRSNEYV